jgi:hypothetical protein
MRRKTYYSLLVSIVSLLAVITAGCRSGQQVGEPTATALLLATTQVIYTLDPSIDPRTATVSALLTQAASAGSPKATTEAQEAGRVTTNTPPPLPTQASAPTAAPPPLSDLEQVWSVRTGDLFYFGAASDGTIYGLGSKLYAVISPEGQVLDTFEMDLGDCLRPNFFGGAGASGASMWFMIQPDGFISSYAGIGGHGPCILTPGSPPSLEKLEYGFEFTPNSTDSQPRPGPDIPEGFKGRVNVTGNIFVQDTRRDDFDFFLNLATRQAGFRNRNNGFSIIDLPSDLDLEKNLQKGSLEIKVTPWDDVYIRYQSYDALGNATGQSIVLVKTNGAQRPISSFPPILEKLWDRSRQLIAYDRMRIEQYYQSGNQLDRTNEDYQIITSLTLPTELVKQNQNLSLWVGHDYAFYAFDKLQKTLTKYIFTSDS